MADALLDKIAAAGSLQELEAVRVAALGKSGEITALLKSLGAMDAETRAAEGPKIHALREAVTTKRYGDLAAVEDADVRDLGEAREAAAAADSTEADPGFRPRGRSGKHC